MSDERTFIDSMVTPPSQGRRERLPGTEGIQKPSKGSVVQEPRPRRVCNLMDKTLHPMTLGCQTEKERDKMNDQNKLEIAEVSNELWNDNLWYRKLNQEDKDAVAHTVWLMRDYQRIKAPRKFAEIFTHEISSMLDAWQSRS
jgi:hypothetical protein